MGNGLKYWSNYFEKAKSEMRLENYNFIKGHIRKIKSTLREQTVAHHLQVLSQFGAWCEKPFNELTENDILDFVDWLDNQTFQSHNAIKKPIVKAYSPGTKTAKLSTVKVFLKNINPEAAKAITIRSQKNKKLPEDLLTQKEIETLLDNCGNSRDRALISFLYESGCRKGELLSIKIKNAALDEYGAVVTLPEGKTGSRRVRVIYSSSFLREWLNDHPLKNNKEAVLFCSLREPYNTISDAGLREQLEKIAKKAGIQKRVNPHSFRHARATHLAEHLTEQQLKNYLGWTPGSNMAQVYVHLSGKNMDDAILKMNGLKIEDKDNNSLKVIKCPRCKEINPESSDYCFKCNLPLKEPLKFENELEELRKRVEIMEKTRNQIKENFKQFSGHFS